MSNTYTDVEYYVNGINFKDYGVYVSASDGLIGKLEKKEALSVDYLDYHGISRDREAIRYKERTIKLKCFISTPSRKLFVERVNEFLCLFRDNATNRLKVEYDGGYKPLVYEVDLFESVEIDKKWASRNDELMVGTFMLTLKESEPVKRVLRHASSSNNSTATITVSTYKLLNIYWGDGTHTFNVSGSNRAVEHTYALAGEYDIVITGVIEDIEQFSTNAIVVWQLLK